jgi:hypothetical protein
MSLAYVKRVYEKFNGINEHYNMKTTFKTKHKLEIFLRKMKLLKGIR